MQQYLELLKTVLENGQVKGDRTGTGTKSLFGAQMRFNLQQGFPLVTTKKIHIRSIIHELLWFISGNTNIRYLQENGVRIWNEWADENGDLGPVYGKQWRFWEDKQGNTIDQLQDIIQLIKTDPDSRRLIVNAWNVGELPSMALMPCHVLFQFYVAEGKLSCQLYQRSADLFLGVPFNIASYSLLTHMLAHQCEMDVGEFIWVGGDCHIYSNHIEQVKTQLERKPFPNPKLEILRKPNDISGYKYEDFAIIDYQYHPTIKAPIAV
ncbi:MAG: thymidylate synthase [Legionellales bacterium]|nr:thymidylate synthase [Legionellales bacterium]